MAWSIPQKEEDEENEENEREEEEAEEEEEEEGIAATQQLITSLASANVLTKGTH